MQYRVIVSCVGGCWLVRVPAFGLAKIVDDKRAIRSEVRKMIVRCGTAVPDFELHLVAGRVVDRDEAGTLTRRTTDDGSDWSAPRGWE